jgi:dTDP-4-dehydrorhamnose reductase
MKIMSNNRILITGAAGLLGSHLLRELKSSFQIIASTNQRKLNLTDVTEIEAIGSDYEIVEKCISDAKVFAIINCLGATNVDACEVNEPLAFKLNTCIPSILAKVSNKLNILFIHFSTDHYISSCSFASEKDDFRAMNIYAKSKKNGEDEVLNWNKNAIILRTNFYGKGEGKISFSEWIKSELQRKNTINLYQDVYFTPLHLFQISNVIKTLLSNNISGLFHLASDERISKYEFGVKLAKLKNLDLRLINKVDYPTSNLPRPRDMSLSNAKLKEALLKLGLFHDLSLDEGFYYLDKEE